MAGRLRPRSEFRPLWRRIPIVRLAIVGTAALLVSWLTLAVGVAGVTREARPDIALRFAPYDARASAKLAESRLASGRPSAQDVSEAVDLARQALQRDPTLAPAVRTLAVSYEFQGQPQRAAQLFHLAERMSRRDTATQLWMIEERVARNDIRGALHHYDVVLRTSESSANLLFPILVAATSSDGIVEPLADLLATRPDWRPFFLLRLSENPSSARNTVQLLRRLAAERDFPERDTIARLVPFFAEHREFEAAWQVYQLLEPTGGTGELLLRNGGFARPNPLPPFDWALTDEPEISALQRPLPGVSNRPVLELSADSGHGGRLARQLLRLGPGRYMLQWRSGSVEGFRTARLIWSLSCAGGRPLLNYEFQSSVPRGSVTSAAFQVPAADCPAQWLDLNVQTSFEPETGAGWINAVTLARAP
jgi:tetratricopeptide (TPR) repeat protein